MMTQIAATSERVNLSDNDYVLVDKAAWFTVKGFAVRVRGTDDGVAIDVYKDGAEMGEPLAHCYVLDADLED